MPSAWAPDRIPEQAGAGLALEVPFNYLWVVRSISDFQAYGLSAQQMVNPAAPPALIAAFPDLGPPNGHVRYMSTIGFAPNGDAWIGDTDTTVPVGQGLYLGKLSAASLASGGPVTPVFSFPMPSIGPSTSGVSAIVVRPNGDMWVSTIANDNRSSAILCYTAASIASPGSPSPSVVIAQPWPPVPSNPSNTNSANDMCFDSTGNLWYVNAVASTINKLSVAQLASTNLAIVPSVVLSAGIQHSGIDFDSDGNLWCGRIAGAVDMFAAADIVATGSPAPTRTISGPERKVRFDRARNMWSLLGSGAVVAYPPASLLATGAPAPSVVMTGAGAIAPTRMIALAP